MIVGDSIVKNTEPYKMKKKCKRRYSGKIDSWSNNRGNDPPCQRLYGWFCAWYCVITLCYKWFKKRTYSSENYTEHIEVGRRVSDGGKRDVLVSGIINRSDDYNAKVQKVNEFLSEIRTRKNMKYIDNGNIDLGMLNRSKLHLNRSGWSNWLKTTVKL